MNMKSAHFWLRLTKKERKKREDTVLGFGIGQVIRVNLRSFGRTVRNEHHKIILHAYIKFSMS